MAKKYYAVKAGRIPGIYRTWDEVKEQVNGYSGAIYKSFETLQEAELFISSSIEQVSGNKKVDTISENLNSKIDEKIANLSEDEIVAFVDGSYNPEAEKAGFGTIIISKGEISTRHINLLENNSVKI